MRDSVWIVAPEVTVSKGAGGFYEAVVRIANPQPMSGIPVKITVSRGDDSAEMEAAEKALLG